jgi:hypothetical protein
MTPVEIYALNLNLNHEEACQAVYLQGVLDGAMGAPLQTLSTPAALATPVQVPTPEQMRE